jgi:uncharacterized membrane protein
MHTIGNIVIALVLVAALASGVSLFWIARQDDSRAGRLIGLLVVAIAAVTLIWLYTGHHWL